MPLTAQPSPEQPDPHTGEPVPQQARPGQDVQAGGEGTVEIAVDPVPEPEHPDPGVIDPSDTYVEGERR